MQIIGLPCPREDTVENTDLQGRCQAGKKQRKGAGFARYGSLSSPLQSQMACKPILGGLQQTVGKLLSKPKERDHAKAIIGKLKPPLKVKRCHFIEWLWGKFGH